MNSEKILSESKKKLDRMYKPFRKIAIPVIEGCNNKTALEMATHLIDSQVQLIGLILVSEEESLSEGNIFAQNMRQKLNNLSKQYGFTGNNQVLVSHNRWAELQTYASNQESLLLILQWPDSFDSMEITPNKSLEQLHCNVAIVQSPWPLKPTKTLIALRGGPNAQAALRMGLALDTKHVSALHMSPPSNNAAVTEDTPFRGLASILPRIPEIDFQTSVSPNPAEILIDRGNNNDLLIIGHTSKPLNQDETFGTIADRLLTECSASMIIVKSEDHPPTQFSGPEGERIGAKAISVLVDKWFAENTYNSLEFDSLSDLVDKKNAQNLTISLALPALNEEKTVGKVIQTIQSALVNNFPLLDEIVLIDSNSSDSTRSIANDLGIPTFITHDILPEYGYRMGKGEALWKSLYVTHGDIVVWIDTDIINIHPRFVYGILGPLITHSKVKYVKGFYQRPLKNGQMFQSTGGGRVTELTARPLINLFYPELSGVIQPLAGEYGGRRFILESVPFFTGYGVETGLLIDIFEKHGLSAIAQVDLFERIHRNQSLQALSKMSFAIIQTMLKKLEHRYNRPILEEVNKSLKLIQYNENNYFIKVEEVIEHMRPPMLEIPEYFDKHHRKKNDK